MTELIRFKALKMLFVREKKMNQRSRTIALLSLLGLLIGDSLAGAVDGDVVYTYGQVLVHRNPATLPAEIGMPEGQGDVI
jgi:hypothetical protein